MMSIFEREFHASFERWIDNRLRHVTGQTGILLKWSKRLKENVWWTNLDRPETSCRAIFSLWKSWDVIKIWKAWVEMKSMLHWLSFVFHIPGWPFHIVSIRCCWGNTFQRLSQSIWGQWEEAAGGGEAGTVDTTWLLEQTSGETTCGPRGRGHARPLPWGVSHPWRLCTGNHGFSCKH